MEVILDGTIYRCEQRGTPMEDSFSSSFVTLRRSDWISAKGDILPDVIAFPLWEEQQEEVRRKELVARLFPAPGLWID